MSFDAAPPSGPALMGTTIANTYPVRYDVVPQHRHNRLSCAFRPLIAIPYAIVTLAISYLALFVSMLAWFTIVFAGRFPPSLWRFTASYMLWRTRFYTYSLLLRDEYPPFGYGPYPAYIDIDYKERRSRLRTFFRGLLVLPQLFVSYFIALAWYVGFVIAWFAILFTGAYPEGLRRFMVGATRWLLRVEAYMLLLVDDYPPFSLGLNEPSTIPPAPDGVVERDGEAEAATDGGFTAPAARMWPVAPPRPVVPEAPSRTDEPASGSSFEEPAFHDFPARPQDDRGE